MTSVKIPYKYTLVITADEGADNEMRILKQKLHDAIGPFHSYRSIAHLTLDWFDFNIETLELYRGLLRKFANQQGSYMLTFNSFDFFKDGQTIFLAPDNSSNEWLKALHKNYKRKLRGQIANSFRPHLTIGKEIEEELRARARAVFANQEISLSFPCTHLALRESDPIKRRYVVIEKFYFKTLD